MALYWYVLQNLQIMNTVEVFETGSKGRPWEAIM